MASLKLKSNSTVVGTYYQEINNLAQLQLFNEGAVSPAFAALLRYCAKQFNWTLSEQHTMKRGKYTIRPDGVLLDSFSMAAGTACGKRRTVKMNCAKRSKRSLRQATPETILSSKALSG